MPYLKLMRPLQWIKNALIFVPILFAREFFVAAKLWPTVGAALAFCLVSSAMYIVNDMFDREPDRLHPTKKHRPLAAGTASASGAGLLLAALLATAGLVLTRAPGAIPPIVAYVLLNLVYSRYLKHLVIFDIITVSVFYLLRILAGGLATATYISRWLVLCTIFTSLLIIVGKRLAELNHSHQRAVLKAYPAGLLKHFLLIAAGLTLVSYGIYSVLGVASERMVYSNLFVLLGVFRYLYIIEASGNTEQPEKLIVSDPVLLGSVIAWLGFVGYIFYF